VRNHIAESRAILRLGLFTLPRAICFWPSTRHLTLAVGACGRKVEYEPALLDTQADDVHGTLGGLPTSDERYHAANERPWPQAELGKRLQGGPLSRNALSCQLSLYRRRVDVSVAGRAVSGPASGGPFAARILPLGKRGFPRSSITMSFGPTFRPKGVGGRKNSRDDCVGVCHAQFEESKTPRAQNGSSGIHVWNAVGS
jgi:hypothetical protein